MGQTNHAAMRKGKHWQALWQGDESLCNLLESPLHWAGERKTPWGKPGERYKHRWGKVRQALRWGPWKFRPSTAYGAFPPAYSVVHHEFLAIGRLNPVLCLDAIPQVGQMSPGVGLHYLLLYAAVRCGLVVCVPKANTRVPSSRPGSGSRFMGQKLLFCHLQLASRMGIASYFVILRGRSNFLRKGGFKL